jgi:hypothetical protein
MKPEQLELLKKLARKAEIEDADVKVVYKGYPGDYNNPPESPELEIEDAILKLPDIAPGEAEMLPREFPLKVSYAYEEEDGTLFDLILEFQVKVLGFSKMGHLVEIHYEDEFLDWEFN